MKRTELKRGRMKQSQPRRMWTHARAKVEREGLCRLGHTGDCEGPLEAAHVIGRECDRTELPGDHTIAITGTWIVEPVRVVPLCRKHHRAYDAHELDLLPVLTLEEQLQAVVDADGLENARVRTAPLAYRGVVV